MLHQLSELVTVEQVPGATGPPALGVPAHSRARHLLPPTVTSAARMRTDKQLFKVQDGPLRAMLSVGCLGSAGATGDAPAASEPHPALTDGGAQLTAHAGRHNGVGNHLAALQFPVESGTQRLNSVELSERGP